MRIISALTCAALAAAMLAGCTAPADGIEVNVIKEGAPTKAPAETAFPEFPPAVSQGVDAYGEETVLPIGDIPLTMIFASGAGAWGTELTLYADGTFEGEYRDGEMGENSDGYPGGTVYFCRFSGKFANIINIDENSYAMTLDELTKDESRGAEWIEDGVRYVQSTAHGIENGRDFILYMPSAQLDGLNAEFLSWWPDYYKLSGETGDIPTTLGRFALMNCAEWFGFFTY